MRHLNIQPLGIDIRERLVRPFAGAFDPLFQSPNRIQILLHFLLIFFSQPTLQPPGVIHHEIEHTGLTLEVGTDLLDPFSSIRIEEPIENFLRTMHRGNRLTRPIMRERLGTSIRSSATLRS